MDSPLDPLSGEAAAPWTRLFDLLGPGGPAVLDERRQQLAHAVREQGISYNLHGNAGGAPRPWPLDLLPVLVTPESWERIAQGVLQRVRTSRC